MYLELGEQGGAGVEVAPRAREVEPREFADRLLQLGIHGLRGRASLAGFSFFLAGGDDAGRKRRTCAREEYVFLPGRRSLNIERSN